MADDAGPEAHLHWQRGGERLGRALRALTDLERVCFVLRHLEQWRIREIAAETGLGESSVKQAIFRGVAKLRTTLGDLRPGPEERP